MKYLLTLFLFITVQTNAQNVLNYNKRFVESEDKWVAFPQEKDSTHIYGFIYIDAEAGLTFNYEGRFKISETGAFIPKKNKETSLKVRLQPNNVLVAFIPENKFKELEIDATPKWLEIYKTGENSIERLYRWGFIYNGYQECAKALTYLEKAEKINPKFPQLAVELAYSYNCLEQYDKAVGVLEKEIKNNPKDAYVNKEYIYALAKTKKIDAATKQFENSKTTIEDKQYDAENCYNILRYFYFEKDKTNFNKWFKILKEIPNQNKSLSQYSNAMNDEINKQ